MANLNVTYQDLHDTATRLLAGKEDMHQKLTELSNLINTLTTNGFQAEHTSGKYQGAFESFTNGTRTAIDGLDDLSRFLNDAATALQQTDEGLAAAIQS